MGLGVSITGLLLRPTSNLAAQVLRYLVVGGMATVVDVALLIMLTDFADLHYGVAAVFAFTAGLLTNFSLSTTWVFPCHSIADRRVEFALFAAIGVVGLLVTELVLWTGSELLLCDYRLSKLVAVGIVLIWNFSLRKLLLFRGGGM